jgi:nucleotide-binding universal stress UspA family protein
VKQVVIATDGSPPAQEVVEVGLELAKEQGADVTFVHDSPPDEFRGGRLGTMPVAHRQQMDESETALNAAADLADATDADLLVVGSRGRGAVAAAVARQCLARSHAAREASCARGPGRSSAGRSRRLRRVVAAFF